jgi:hypothetical protein
VISALGPTRRRSATGTPLTEGTRRIVAAMDAAGVRRFVGLATPGVADRRDWPTRSARVLPVVTRLAFPNALTELVGMTEAVTRSDLDGTLARITRPTGPPAARSGRSTYARTRSGPSRSWSNGSGDSLCRENSAEPSSRQPERPRRARGLDNLLPGRGPRGPNPRVFLA